MATLKELALVAPRAHRHKVRTIRHSEVRTDNFAWFEERDTPHVLHHLNRENLYADKVLEGFQKEVGDIFNELMAIGIQAQTRLWFARGEYDYYVRTTLPYGEKVYIRKTREPDAKEEIVLDTRIIASKKRGYCKLSKLVVSPDNKTLAYGVDWQGMRKFKLKFRNIETGEDYPESIDNTEGGHYVWTADSQACFYILKNPITLLTEKVRRHIIGFNPDKNETVHHEKDSRFYLKLSKINSGKYIVITSYMEGRTSECRLLDAADTYGHFSVFEPRQDKILYYLQHRAGHFYILTNKDAPKFRILRTPEGMTTSHNWQEVVPESPESYYEFFSLTKDYIVIKHRVGNSIGLMAVNQSGQKKSFAFLDKSFSLYLVSRQDLSKNVCYYDYSTLSLPPQTIAKDLDSGADEVKHEVIIPGYERSHYKVKETSTIAHDGREIPATLVYDARHGELKDRPMLIYAYGAYGANYEPEFHELMLPLVNRGFCLMLAHIRGGSDLGPYWYEEGRRLAKKNTFRDFISMSEHVIKEGYTSSAKLFAMGRSAGGLLMGVILNERPDLYKGVVAEVPFVDPLNTMLDDSLPLVPNELHEWGDPVLKKDYDYIKSYSPYENIQPLKYPHIFAETGYHDSQVMFFEPVKWVAKLRQHKKGNNLLLLRIHMRAGHSGPSNYRDYLYDKAEKMGFIYGIIKHGY